MHEILNLADLFIGLLRGTIDRGASDSLDSWDWVVLTGEVWEKHGADVSACLRFIPSCHGRAPRNPAEKINSGYKAWEHLLYLFELGPGLFLGVIPMEYYRTYCKLVAGVRILYQKCISRKHIERAQKLLLEFIDDFERLFYQRRTDRLHFVRQSIHNLWHWAPETFRLGPSACYSQWTMERFIGLTTAYLRQHSTPYENLSRIGLERAQLNALDIMVPNLHLTADAIPHAPHGSIALSDNYRLLRALERHSRAMTEREFDALRAYLMTQDVDMPNDWDRKIQRWSRLYLPNGQVARSEWKEALRAPEKLRRARDVKVRKTQRLHAISNEQQLDLNGTLEFAEVRYYFELDVAGQDKALAMVCLCTRPDQELLELSSHTLWSCQHQGDDGLRVVEYNTIRAVVAMPHHSSMLPDAFRDHVFVAEMPGLEIAEMGWEEDDIEDEED
ncbi:hypothetical protein EXIGLDRAFT_623344 [Exidia glandulosa HHB12029]|uniref:Uncharacterized protein n=1 Tax=Exidia glandulosa HHB12029 TaxID=1314781 RepID=A0A165DQN1_EXIGL|nr:hypothetical protein EXIGLDRAFT_623344 [Exidia glandulosa HHB12029]